MPGRRLDYADRVRRDLDAIEKYHLEVAGDVIADRIIDAILSHLAKEAKPCQVRDAIQHFANCP